MNIFYDQHRIVLASLVAGKVDFLLVGGYAVIYHGYNRLTGDMDLWIKPDNANKESLTTVFEKLGGFDVDSLATIRSWDFTIPQVFHIGNNPDRIDFMTHIAGVRYNEAKSVSVKASLDQIKIDIIHIATLIQNKKASGRKKDLADAEKLEEIMRLRNRGR